MKMQAKTITIRVSYAEFATLSAQAEEQKTSATRYATTLVKSGLQGRLEEDRLAALEARLMARMNAQDESMRKVMAFMAQLEGVTE